MAPRLSKRKQRELEELKDLESVEVGQAKSDASDSGEEAHQVAKKPIGGGFAALGLMSGDEVENSENEREELDLPKPVVTSSSSSKKKSKKKKKKVDGGSPVLDNLDPVSDVVASKTSKKGKGKGKPKGTQEDEEDLDKVLAEFRISSSSKGGGQSSSNNTVDSLNALLAVSLPHLDSEAEMRRFFGSKVISSTNAQSKGPRGGRRAVQNLKSNLTKPQPTWWNAAQREGLSLIPLSDDEVSAKEERSGLSLSKKEKWWTVQYSDRYRSVTKAFVSAVTSNAVDRFYGIMARLPWHADTLLQLSEVYRHQEEHSESVDFLNRALFTYERALIGAFTFATGANRLDFDRVENRPFYLAVARNVADLQRRGSQRASFEFARLLYSLDPYTDPHGSLLYLDYLSIKAGMQDWILSLWVLHENWAADAEMGLGCFNVTALPGWAFGRALALRAKEDADKSKDRIASSAALRDAILSFPSVVPLVADKADISLPGDVRGHSAFAVQIDASQLSDHEAVLHLLSHLYAHRSSSLWKIPENASWLAETVVSSVPSIGTAKTQASQKYRKRFENQFRSPKSFALRRSIYRHAFTLSDANAARRLTSFFPRDMLRNTINLICDPLPPETALTHYDNTFFEGTEDVFAYRPRTRREQELDARNMVRVVPDPARRQLLMGLFEAHPQLQEMFPDGVVHFAQRVAQLPDEVLDDLVIGDGFIDVRDRAGGGGEAMPGGLGLEDFNDADAGNDDGNVDVAGNVGGPRAGEGREEGLAGAQLEQDRRNVGEVAAGAEDDLEGDEEEDDENHDAPIFPLRVIRGLMNRIWGAAPAEGAQDEDDSD